MISIKSVFQRVRESSLRLYKQPVFTVAIASHVEMETFRENKFMALF